MSLRPVRLSCLMRSLSIHIISSDSCLFEFKSGIWIRELFLFIGLKYYHLLNKNSYAVWNHGILFISFSTRIFPLQFSGQVLLLEYIHFEKMQWFLMKHSLFSWNGDSILWIWLLSSCSSSLKGLYVRLVVHESISISIWKIFQQILTVRHQKFFIILRATVKNDHTVRSIRGSWILSLCSNFHRFYSCKNR